MRLSALAAAALVPAFAAAQGAPAQPAATPAATTPAPAAATPAAVTPAPAAAPAPAAKAERSIAVLDLSTSGDIPAGLAATVGQAMASHATSLPGFKVLSRDDIRRVLSFEQERQLLGCPDEQCVVSIGGALGADWIITGNLGQLGGRFLISVRAVDIKAGKALGAADRTVNTIEELAETAKDLIHKVLTGAERESKGVVAISVTERDARILVDGQAIGISPLTDPLRLIGGRHRIRVEKTGFITWEGAVELVAGTTTTVEVGLQAEGGSLVGWYATALALGVAAAGGGAVMGYLAGDAYCRQPTDPAGACYNGPIPNAPTPTGDATADATARENYNTQVLRMYGYLNAPEYFAMKDREADVKLYAQFANIGFIAGGALGALGAGLFVVDLVVGRAQSAAKVKLSATPVPGGMLVALSF
jgi:TolB-like protein